MKKIVTIAGSDTSGGAGLEADLRTFMQHGLYGMAAITVIVTMDPKNNWAHGVFPIEVSEIEKQLETVFDGVGVDTVKTGMLPTVEIIELVAGHLENCYGKMPIVIDPVMVCKGDKPLFPEHAEAIAKTLLKYSTVTTANLFEAGQLAGMGTLTTLSEAKKACENIVKSGSKSVVIKMAGNLDNPQSAGDLFFDGNDFFMAEGPKVNTTYTHGLGCTYAANIASLLCLGENTKNACIITKEKLTRGLEHSFALNQYVGTLDFNR
jgi:pyridoxine kinase